MRQAARLAPSTGRFFRDVIRDARFHGRGDADRAMNAAEVVVREIQRKRRPVVLKLLRESVGQASESPNLHPHGEVLTLNVRRANTFRIGGTHNWDHLRAHHFSRAIARFAFRECAVHFYQSREIHAVSKGVALCRQHSLIELGT